MYLSRALRPSATAVAARLLGPRTAERLARPLQRPADARIASWRRRPRLWALDQRYGLPALARHLRRLRGFRRDDGSVSVEYVFATLAAVTLGGVLVWVVSQERFRNALLDRVMEYVG